jgi:hypothetical protein
MADTRIQFKYYVGDVTSAQRMRFLHSTHFKLILLFWVGTVLLLIANVLFPRAGFLFENVTWTLVGQVTLAYFGSLVFILLVVPWVSFHLNRFWRLPLVFQFNYRNMRLSVAGKSGGLRLNWDQIRRVEGNLQVYIIYYDDGQKHFILPKSAFKPQQDKRFRDMLARYTPAGKEEVKAAALAEDSKPEIAEPEETGSFESDDVLDPSTADEEVGDQRRDS